VLFNQIKSNQASLFKVD